MELSCKVQNYEWGKLGLDSMVAKLQKNSDESFNLDTNLPYAELWMGTHVNAPSIVKQTKEKLSDLIAKRPECLGEKVIENFGNELPFLFKVLSVNKALSIQAHPSKSHAEQLHATFPNIYKDPNHKPEMAIALTQFEALCGFRPIEDIKQFVKDIPELKNIICSADDGDKKKWLQMVFRSVLTCEKENIIACIDGILQRYANLGSPKETEYFLVELFKRLHSEFPYDNGILMIYFLNYLKLEPSQAIFLGANEPHAYLFGDCIECMACSDNVVRAGLTPKFVDVDTLCEMLLYEGAMPESKLFTPKPEDEYLTIFRPPVPDFAVACIKIPSSKSSYEIPKRDCASIVLVICGTANYNEGSVVEGTILFIPANETVQFSNIKGELIMYQALANV